MNETIKNNQIRAKFIVTLSLLKIFNKLEINELTPPVWERAINYHFHRTLVL